MADIFANVLLDHSCLSFLLISGASISGERFYAKHRMLSIPAYRIPICTVLGNSYGYLHSFQHFILLFNIQAFHVSLDALYPNSNIRYMRQ